MSSSQASSHSYQLNLCSIPLLQVLATTSSSREASTSPSAELGASAKAVAATAGADEDNADEQGQAVETAVGPASALMPVAGAGPIASSSTEFQEKENAAVNSPTGAVEGSASTSALMSKVIPSNVFPNKMFPSKVLPSKVFPFMQSAPEADATSIKAESPVPAYEHKRHDSAIDTSPSTTTTTQFEASTILPPFHDGETAAMTQSPEIDLLGEMQGQLHSIDLNATNESAVDGNDGSAPMPEIEEDAGIRESGQDVIVQHDTVASSASVSEDAVA